MLAALAGMGLSAGLSALGNYKAGKAKQLGYQRTARELGKIGEDFKSRSDQQYDTMDQMLDPQSTYGQGLMRNMLNLGNEEMRNMQTGMAGSGMNMSPAMLRAAQNSISKQRTGDFFQGFGGLAGQASQFGQMGNQMMGQWGNTMSDRAQGLGMARAQQDATFQSAMQPIANLAGQYGAGNIAGTAPNQSKQGSQQEMLMKLLPMLMGGG